VVWNVFAAPELSLTRNLVLSRRRLRGLPRLFRATAAERCAAGLSQDGYDVFVWGATAYSTLGWFDDPVLSTFLRLDPAQLAALMFHELAIGGYTSRGTRRSTKLRLRRGADGPAALGRREQ